LKNVEMLSKGLQRRLRVLKMVKRKKVGWGVSSQIKIRSHQGGEKWQTLP